MGKIFSGLRLLYLRNVTCYKIFLFGKSIKRNLLVHKKTTFFSRSIINSMVNVA